MTKPILIAPARPRKLSPHPNYKSVLQAASGVAECPSTIMAKGKGREQSRSRESAQRSQLAPNNGSSAPFASFLAAVPSSHPIRRRAQTQTRLLSALGGSQLRLSPPPLRRHLLGCSRPRLCALLQALAPVAVAVAVGMTDSNVQGNGFPAPFAVGMLTARRPPFTSVCARGPDAGFAAFTRRFLAQVADPASPNVSFLRRRGIGGSNPTSSSRGSANHRFRCGRRRPLGRSLGSVRNSAISSSCLSLLFVAIPLARNPSRTTFVVPATQRRPIGLAGAGIWRMSDQKVYAHHRQWISRNRDAFVGLCLRRTSSTAAAATATERS